MLKFGAGSLAAIERLQRDLQRKALFSTRMSASAAPYFSCNRFAFAGMSAIEIGAL